MFSNEDAFRAWFSSLNSETRSILETYFASTALPAMEAMNALIQKYIELSKLFYDAIERTVDRIISTLGDIEQYVDEANEVVDKRAAERKRWGHPTKVLHANYSQPVRKIRPNARSHIRQRSDRRRA